jgi:quinol-cytochrome oxidoreductase complex cytochrome b subunit
LQALTGGTLLIFYAPTPDHAWESLDFLQHHLPIAHLLRSLHSWAASLIVLAASLHLLRVVFHGAYKKPRELNWVTGWAAFLVILGFLFTGHLLPWDQKGYWGSIVGLEMIGKTPVFGEWLQTLLQGGSYIGAYTLSRFFALHVFFLPVVLVGLSLGHLLLLRHHGVAPGPAEKKEESFPFYPKQVFRDGTGFLLVTSRDLSGTSWRTMSS